MPRFGVTIKEIECYNIEVDAVDEDEAQEKAWEILTSCEDKDVYHDDSEGQTTVYDVD